MVLPLLAVPIAAAAISSIGKILGGISAKKAAKRRAAQLRQGAQMDLDESGVEAQLALEEDERVGASLAVNAAAGSGGGLRGSALDVLNDLGRQSLGRARAITYRGQTEAWARRNEAREVKKAGSQALTSSIFSAASSFLSSTYSAYATRGG